MYTLFYSPGSAAMAPHAALEEIGAPYKLVKVDLKAGEHRQSEYLKLNPKGRVPVLIVDGESFTESAAILMHLCDRHAAAGLMPAPGTPDRARAYQWLLYLSNTVQAAMTEYFHPDWTFDDAALRAPLKASAEQRIARMFGYIDDELGRRGPHLLGPAFQAPDLYLHMLTRWSRFFTKPGYTYPHIKRCVDAVKARPAVARMMAAQGLVEQEKA
jgi:glutathione S-transferase